MLGATNGESPISGWRSVSLRDILPEAAIDKLIPIMNKISQRKIDDIEGRKRILAVLEKHREELLKKEVLPEYLSYMLLAIAMRGGGGELGSVGL